MWGFGERTPERKQDDMSIYSEFCSLDKGYMLERGMVDSPPLKFGLGLFCVFADCKDRDRSHAGLMPRPFSCQ